MKKIISLVLAAILMTAALCSCGDDTSYSEPNSESKESNKIVSEDETLSGELARVKEAGELIIGMTEFAPLNYKAEDGSWTGFETEFAEAVCAELGVKAEFQVINWASKVTELNGKTIDCIWNGMTITDEISAETSISTPYLENKQVVIVKEKNKAKFEAENPDLTGLVVVAEADSAGEQTIESEKVFEGCTYTPVADMATALLEVNSGTADAAVIDYIMSIGSIGEGTDYTGLTAVVYDEFVGEQYGIAFRKGSDLQAEVNAIITKLVESGKLSEIADKYKLKDFVIAK